MSTSKANNSPLIAPAITDHELLRVPDNNMDYLPDYLVEKRKELETDLSKRLQINKKQTYMEFVATQEKPTTHEKEHEEETKKKLSAESIKCKVLVAPGDAIIDVFMAEDQKFKAFGINWEIKPIIGDIQIINEEDESMLMVIERKTCDDLRQSIMYDSRWHIQRKRMTETGCPRYLWLEGTMVDNIIRGAIIKSMLIDRIETITFSTKTQMITKLLEICKALNKGYHLKHADYRFTDSQQVVQFWKEQKTHYKKKSDFIEENRVAVMVSVINNCSFNPKGLSVQKVYPTPQSLVAAWLQCSTQKEAEEMLHNTVKIEYFGPNESAIGVYNPPEKNERFPMSLSKQIFDLFGAKAYFEKINGLPPRSLSEIFDPTYEATVNDNAQPQDDLKRKHAENEPSIDPYKPPELPTSQPHQDLSAKKKKKTASKKENETTSLYSGVEL